VKVVPENGCTIASVADKVDPVSMLSSLSSHLYQRSVADQTVDLQTASSSMHMQQNRLLTRPQWWYTTWVHRLATGLGESHLIFLHLAHHRATCVSLG
jgi:hypothetical protein